MKHVAVPADDLRERFILFLASKPAGQIYNWNSHRHCACATFIEEQLTKRIRHWYRPWGIKQRDVLQVQAVWRRWNGIAATEPRTYGAMLKRVRELA
jgi:hypothetical protein